MGLTGAGDFLPFQTCPRQGQRCRPVVCLVQPQTSQHSLEGLPFNFRLCVQMSNPTDSW